MRIRMVIDHLYNVDDKCEFRDKCDIAATIYFNYDTYNTSGDTLWLCKKHAIAMVKETLKDKK